MKRWQWCIVALLLVGCILGIILGVLLSKVPAPLPSPRPSTTIQPFPSLTMTPRFGVVTLLHDTFQGPASLMLTQHVPNAPLGIFWVNHQASSETSMKLTGTGAASNLENTSPSPAALAYVGANGTSGKFTNLGYDPKTDTLSMHVTLEIPTITPRPTGSENILMFFSLYRTVPQHDILVIGFEYRVGQAASNPPSWILGASTVYDNGGLNMKTQNIVDTGFVTGDPPLNTPVHFSLSIEPDGRCTVVCPELNVNASGPTQPDIIPQEEFAMHSFSMFVLATQEISTAAQPLQVHITEVLVTGERQLTENNRTTVEPLLPLWSEPELTPSPPTYLQQRMQELNWSQ